MMQIGVVAELDHRETREDSQRSRRSFVANVLPNRCITFRFKLAIVRHNHKRWAVRR